MSLSTPESKPTTGISSGFGLFQQGLEGLGVNSREADGGGFLVESGLEHFNLLVDHGFGLGTFEGDVNIQVLGSLFGPNFTACQNWCWKPLEITGM